MGSQIMPFNKEDGIDYTSVEDNNKAKKADLITLPEEVKGTNCANCKFVKIIEEKAGLGFCEHPDVKLNVTKRMCCKLWDHNNASRSWKKE